MNNFSLNPQVWILASGRLLLQFGTGFTLFYAPIFFVNELKFSPTIVGIALGSASVSGIIGRFWGGSWSDSPEWGRKKTLLLSALISAFADIFLATANDFSFLLIGNLLMGLGIGLYWPAAEASVADLTTEGERNPAFAITRLADNVGLGCGVAIGGWLVAQTNNYRLLFIIDGFSFIFFYAVISWTIAETFVLTSQTDNTVTWGWKKAFKDNYLWTFFVVNVMFTTYMAVIQSILPLYFTNFTIHEHFSITNLSGLFSLHIALAALFQLPMVKVLNSLSHIQGLILASLLWGISFFLIWLTGNVVQGVFLFGILSVLFGAIAMVTYNPSASALVVDLAPDSLRGIYFAINSQCWAVGYFIGPTLGGWILDQGDFYAHNLWLFLIISTLIAIVILKYLQHQLTSKS
jgi:MFS family permease